MRRESLMWRGASLVGDFGLWYLLGTRATLRLGIGFVGRER